MTRYFAPNGVVTFEECAECREPDIKIEHGHEVDTDEDGNETGRRPAHIEHCPVCGEGMVIVCYDCPNCERVGEPAQ